MLLRTLAISLLLSAAALAAPTVSQLNRAPVELTIAQSTVKVDKAYIWRDAQNLEEKSLTARVTLDNLPQGARITGLYIVQKDQIWTTTHPEVRYNERMQMATARGGPNWEANSKVDVIVEIARAGQTYRLRIPAQPVSQVN